MKLEDIASVIRSKNAGPRALTLDVMFADDAGYARAAQSPALTAPRIAALYGAAEGDVRVIPYPFGRAIKIVMPRRITAGDPGDTDAYGAQQHLPSCDRIASRHRCFLPLRPRRTARARCRSCQEGRMLSCQR